MMFSWTWIPRDLHDRAARRSTQTEMQDIYYAADVVNRRRFDLKDAIHRSLDCGGEVTLYVAKYGGGRVQSGSYQ